MKKEKTWEEKRVRIWVTSHRGILTRIAVQLGVSPQFVQSVAYDKSTSVPGVGARGNVEGALKQAGWPGVHRLNQNA